MKLILQLTKEDGTVIHEVQSPILNGIFYEDFDQGFVPEDEKGRLLKIELGFHFQYSEDYLNLLVEKTDDVPESGADEDVDVGEPPEAPPHGWPEV